MSCGASLEVLFSTRTGVIMRYSHAKPSFPEVNFGRNQPLNGQIAVHAAILDQIADV
jgi:hypothetical protein